MTAPFALYCKSYRTDLLRVVRLAESIRRFNQDRIPFYVSVPSLDAGLFRSNLAGHEVTVIEDEAITAANPRIRPEALRALPGSLSQQIVKSEFWRLNLADAYMCLDSDAVFIRPIRQSEFLVDGDTPYTVIDEAHEFLESALQAGRHHAILAFRDVASKVQSALNRTGRGYSFGPFPVLWHRAVWESLDREYLLPRGMNLSDAIALAPAESHWYGEALLKYRAIALAPCQPLFKVYHYAWEFDRDRRKGITQEKLGQVYCGAIHQSAWERELDWPQEGGSLASRIGRRARRMLGRI
jgi:hypothetical protein